MLRRLVLGASRFLDYIAALAMIALLLVTCANVASRAIFDRPIAGALEASMLLMPVIIFGAMAWVFVKVGHFAMSSLVDARGGALRSASMVLQIILGLLVFVLLSFESAELLIRSIERQEYFAGPVNIPVYYSRFFIMSGSIVTASAILFVFLPDWLRSARTDTPNGEGA